MPPQSRTLLIRRAREGSLEAWKELNALLARNALSQSDRQSVWRAMHQFLSINDPPPNSTEPTSSAYAACEVFAALQFLVYPFLDSPLNTPLFAAIGNSWSVMWKWLKYFLSCRLDYTEFNPKGYHSLPTVFSLFIMAGREIPWKEHGCGDLVCAVWIKGMEDGNVRDPEYLPLVANVFRLDGGSELVARALDSDPKKAARLCAQTLDLLPSTFPQTKTPNLGTFMAGFQTIRMIIFSSFTAHDIGTFRSYGLISRIASVVNCLLRIEARKLDALTLWHLHSSLFGAADIILHLCIGNVPSNNKFHLQSVVEAAESKVIYIIFLAQAFTRNVAQRLESSPLKNAEVSYSELMFLLLRVLEVGCNPLYRALSKSKRAIKRSPLASSPSGPHEPLISRGWDLFNSMTEFLLSHRTSYKLTRTSLCFNPECSYNDQEMQDRPRMKECCTCRSVVYCSASCQSSHRRLHIPNCRSPTAFPYMDTSTSPGVEALPVRLYSQRDASFFPWIKKFDPEGLKKYRRDEKTFYEMWPHMA